VHPHRHGELEAFVIVLRQRLRTAPLPFVEAGGGHTGHICTYFLHDLVAHLWGALMAAGQEEDAKKHCAQHRRIVVQLFSIFNRMDSCSRLHRVRHQTDLDQVQLD